MSDKKCTFSQAKRTNVAVCDGCDAHCKIGTELYQSRRFLPTIGGVCIRKYINKYGEEVSIIAMMDQIKCMDLAYQIATHCDYYKSR